MTLILLSIVASYLVGSLPFGLWTGLLWKGVDIRTQGSKNIGATNVLRVLGPGPAAVAFLLDVGKGAFGVVLLRQLWAHQMSTALPMWAVIAVALAAILGHTFSGFLRFRGGKGVATSLGALLALSLPVALVALGLWILVVALTRYVSLASLVAGVALPVASVVLLTGEARLWMFGLTAALCVLVTVKHQANIGRLLAGTESKFGQRVQAAPTDPTEVHHG